MSQIRAESAGGRVTERAEVAVFEVVGAGCTDAKVPTAIVDSEASGGTSIGIGGG